MAKVRLYFYGSKKVKKLPDTILFYQNSKKYPYNLLHFPGRLD